MNKISKPKSSLIQLFVSISTGPYPDPNIPKFLDQLADFLDKQGFKPETLGITSFSHTKGFIHISKAMSQSSGAIIIGISRDYFTGIEKYYAEEKKTEAKKWKATRWNHIEGAMAYEVGLPLFIISDDRIQDSPDGIFDRNNHAYEVHRINFGKPEELFESGDKHESFKKFLRQCREYYDYKEQILVYYSLATAISPAHKEFFAVIVSYLNERNIILVNGHSPEVVRRIGECGIEFKQIRSAMNLCKGAIIFGLERDLVKTYEFRKPIEEIEEKKKKDLKIWSDTWFSTVWNDIEGAIAYQHDLPLLIMKQDSIFKQIVMVTDLYTNNEKRVEQNNGDGIFDENNHQYKVISISLEKPFSKVDGDLKGFIDDWINSVRLKQNNAHLINIEHQDSVTKN